MAFVDLPLLQLESYLPERVEAGDFDQFWDDTLTDARSQRDDRFFFELVDGAQVHLSGVNEISQCRPPDAASVSG